MIKVKLTQDDAGHWYCIPNELEDQFDEDLEEQDYEVMMFWQKYRTNGGVNNIQLYIDEKEIKI